EASVTGDDARHLWLPAIPAPETGSRNEANFLPCDFLLGCCRHQLIAKFFRPSSQGFDVLLLVSFFEGLCPFIDVRLAPPQQAVNQRRQFPGSREHRHVSPDAPRHPPIVGCSKAVGLRRSASAA